MASEIRDFKNFAEFPGKLNESTGIYEFPMLRHKDSMDRVRQWSTFVRLIKSASAKADGIDWNLLDEKQVKIKPEYFEEQSIIPAGITGETWVECGVEGGKITMHNPTYFINIANEGKANERNVFQCALIAARSIYLKRKERGGSETGTSIKIHRGSRGTTMYFPMLAKTYKDGAKHIVYPAMIQPKLDGNRCLTYLTKKDGGYESVCMYSRTKKPFVNMDFYKKLLYPYLNDLFDEENNQSLFLDGELYRHGKKLQDISGESRGGKRDNKDAANTNINQYWLYDCFYPLELDVPMSTRLLQLNELFSFVSKDSAANQIIMQITTEIVDNEQQATVAYKKFMTMGFEGGIIRNIDGVYAADSTKSSSALRSNDLIKMKPKFTDEFECVGFTQGTKGKDKGAVIWIVKIVDSKKELDEVVLNVTNKDMTYKERYALYQECLKHFDDKYRSRMLTVEYEDLSKDGIPLRAKALVFRDYE